MSAGDAAGWRVIIGNDEAGVEHKDALKALLDADSRVASVLDVSAEKVDAICSYEPESTKAD